VELLLTEEQAVLRDAAAKLFARVAGPKKLRALRDSNSGFDRAAWDEIAAAGYLDAAALGATELCLVLVEAGAALCTLPVGPAAVCATDNGALVLPALGKVIPFATEADGLLTGDGLVTPDKLAIKVLRLVDGSAAGELRSALPPPEDRVRDLVALGQGAELTGVMDRALSIALEYLKTRVQFDKKIGSFQALQHRAVDEYMEVELTRSLVFQVAAAFDRGQGNAAMAAAVKARASAAALRVCKTALQFHGAMGYTDEHDIGLYLKRAMTLVAQFGNEAESRRRFARLAGIEPG
jgi:alkylation response protein AidB-like acyl-CoA dehydrogenase